MLYTQRIACRLEIEWEGYYRVEFSHGLILKQPDLFQNSYVTFNLRIAHIECDACNINDPRHARGNVGMQSLHEEQVDIL